MSEQPKRLVIENKASGPKWEKQWFCEIQEAIVSGYRIADNPYSADATMRNYQGFMGRAVLYLPGFEPLKGEPKGVPRTVSSIVEVAPTVDETLEVAEVLSEDPEVLSEDPEAKLEDLTKKKDLLAFAKKAGVEVPSSMNVPSQIKKFIKDHKTT
jgi:hypothetical protein